MLSGYKEELPDHLDEFDVPIERFFTDKYTKIMKANTDIYLYLAPYTKTKNFFLFHSENKKF